MSIEKGNSRLGDPDVQDVLREYFVYLAQNRVKRFFPGEHFCQMALGRRIFNIKKSPHQFLELIPRPLAYEA